MTNDVSDIIKGLELIHICCETIADCGGCDRCPVGNDCFEYNSLLDSYENIPAKKWQEFLDYADDVEEITADANMTQTELNYESELDCYDRQMKGERDERYVDETYGW